MSTSVRQVNTWVPGATVPGPQGTVGTQGPQGVQGDLAASSIVNGVTGTRTPASTLVTTQLWNLAGNVTVGMPGAPATGALSGTLTLSLKQPASGGPYTVTWPAALEWPNDAAGPAMPTPANSELIVNLFWTGYVWRALVMGVFYP